MDSSASEEKKTEEKSEKEKKETEKKAEEEKKEAEKKPETEQTESAVDEKKAETPVEAVNKTIKDSKKTNLTVPKEVVIEVLSAKNGSLNLTLKGAFVKLFNQSLSTLMGSEAKEVRFTVKNSSIKKNPKSLGNRKLVSKKAFDVKVTLGKENLNKFDLKGEKISVKLKVSIEKAPEKIYVLNLKTGKIVRARYKKGSLSFKTDAVGKFVIVRK